VGQRTAAKAGNGPAFVPPMEPVTGDRAFDDPAYLYEVKWDGVRCIAVVDGAVRLYARSGQDRTDRFPELAGLARAVRGQRAVLDGECTVMSPEGPSFPRILRRQSSPPDSGIVRAYPVTYFVFDLLYAGGRWLLDQPCQERRNALRRLVDPAGPVQLSPSFASGPLLFEMMKGRGWEGIVAKRKDSPYLPGRKSPAWVKIKCWRRGVFAVVGMQPTRGGTSLLLAAADEAGRAWYVGRVQMRTGRIDPSVLPQDAVSDGPPGPHFPRDPSIHWLVPLVLAEVRYLEWTPRGHLRFPSLVKLRAGTLQECRI